MANPVPGQLARFAAVGAASTAVHLGLYLLLRGALGPLGANIVALLITALGNTAANRRLTFGVHGTAGAARHQFWGLVVLGLGIGLTTGSLALLGAWIPGAGRVAEVAVLVAASGAVTVLRFVAFRSWIFGAPGPGRDEAGRQPIEASLGEKPIRQRLTDQTLGRPSG